MNQRQKSGRIPVEEAATEEEIVQAFEALSENELRRLYKYSDFFVRKFSYKLGDVYTRDDLFNEAVHRTFEGKRRWRKDILEFGSHLIGAMRSIVDEWSKTKIEGKLYKIHQDKEDRNPIDDLASSASEIEDNLAAREEIERIEKHFSRDSQALEVIEGLRAELKGPEIKELLNFNQTQYETVIRRIRRGVEKLKKEGEIHG